MKNAIIVIDATPFRQWYEAHYILPLGRKRETKQQLAEDPVLNKKRCRATMAKYLARQRFAKVEPALEEQFGSGRLLGMYLNDRLIKSNVYIILFAMMKNPKRSKNYRFAFSF